MDAYEAFLHDNFVVEEFARKLLEENSSIPEQLALLNKNVSILDKHLKEQIAIHYERLLSQATNLESLEDILSTLTHHVSALQCSVSRACDKVSGLYKKTDVRTKQLNRLHETCSLLRNVIRVLQLSNRLSSEDKSLELQKGKMPFPKDLVKCSQIVQELRDLSATEPGLRTLGVVEKELANLPKMTSEILASARSTLKQGARSQHQAQVASALQAFYNLKCLLPQLEGYGRELLNEVKHILKDFESFSFQDETKKSGDISAPVLSQNPMTSQVGGGKSSVTARANAWNDIGRLAEFLASVCTQLLVIHTVASKKREADAQRFLKDSIGGTEFYATVWIQIVNQIEVSCSNANPVVRQTLESEYPRLLRYMSTVLSKLSQCQHILPNGESMLRSALQSIESSYLSKSLARLFDSVNLVFHASSISMSSSSSQIANAPANDSSASKLSESSRNWLSKSELDTILRSIEDELNVSKFDPMLFEHMSKNVAKTLHMFGTKCEQLLCTEDEGSQILGPLTPGQKRNVDVVNALNYLLHCINSLSNFHSDFTVGASAVLSGLMGTAVGPLFISISDALSSIISTMHQETYCLSNVQAQKQQQCSLYVRELQNFTSRVWRDYLSPFECSDLVYQEAASVARKAAELFVLHASLVRPIDEQGKLRLIADFSQTELALSTFCRQSPPDDLGPSKQRFKAMRQLLAWGDFATLASSDSADCTFREVELPRSLIVHLLICASPDELKSPYETTGWSVTEYAEWYFKSSESERLRFLRGCLEAYARLIQSEGKAEYVPLYPVLLRLVDESFAQNI